MRKLTLALALLICGTALAQEPAVDAGSAVPEDVKAAVVATDTDAGVAAPASAVEDVAAPDVAAPASAVEDVAAPASDVAAPAPAADVTPAPPTEPVHIPSTDAEAGSVIGMLLNAAQNGHWTVFGGLLVLLLIWGLNKFGLKDKVGSKLVPWVTLGVSSAGAIAVGLAQGAPLVDSLKLGLLDGGIAIALWELVAKHFMSSGKTSSSPTLSE